MIADNKSDSSGKLQIYSHYEKSKITNHLKQKYTIGENVKTNGDTLSSTSDFTNNIIFQIATNPFLVVEADGTIVQINKAGEEFFQGMEINLINFKSFIDRNSHYVIDNLISKTLVNNKKVISEIVLNINNIPIPVQITAFAPANSSVCIFEIDDLTERIHLHNLRSVELSYQTLIEEASIGIFVTDVEGNFSSVNKYGCDLLGYTSQELLTMNMTDVFLADEIKEKPIQLQKMLNGYQVFSERNMVRKDGSLIAVEISGKVLSDGRVQGIVRSLTDQKKAEQALMLSEANYKHAESIAHLGSWQMDIKTGKSKWSDEFFRICGYEPQSFEPTKYLRYQVIHPDDRELSEKTIQRAISEKSSYRLEKRVLRPDGEVRYILSVGEIILDNNNQPSELKGVFLDITELKKIEFSLKKSEEKYRQLLEFLPIGMVIKNKTGEVIYQNKKADEIFDIDPNAEKYTSDHDFRVTYTDENIMPSEEYPSNRAFIEEHSVENVEMGITLNNRKIWINATAAPMPGNEEVVLAFMDITDKIEREKQLNTLSEKLQELNVTKDKFFSIIAHDLKNPFNSILGFSELLLKKINSYSPEEIEKFVGIIYDTSQKTYNLLENLLLWSRTQTGSMEYSPEILNLNELVEDNIEFVRPTALKKQIRIISEYVNVSQVFSDKNMIDTVFRNILTNAVKFSYPQSEIQVKIFEESDFYVVSIKDFGIGIDPGNLKKLFRIDSKISVQGTNKEKGSGLGLLLSKEFIEKNSGKISVKSEFGKGAEFEVFLPKANDLSMLES